MLPKSLQRGSLPLLLLGVILVWAPLPAGSVTPGGKLVFRLAAFAVLLASLAPAPAAAARAWRRRLLPAAALAGVGLLGLVQSCGWPAGAAGLLGEERVEIHRQAAQLTGSQAARASPSLSLAPANSRSAALSWLAAASLLAASLLVGRDPRACRWLLAALLAGALVELAVGMVGLAQQAPHGLTRLLLQPEGRLKGTFANPNHLSLLFEIALAVAAAWSWWAWSRRAGRWPARLGAALTWGLLFAAVVLTGSRAGLVAAVAGTAVQVLALLAAGPRRRAAVMTLALTIGLAALAVVGSRLEIERYAAVSRFEDNFRGRLEVVTPALELWRRFPLAGTGLGTFQEAFPLVLPPEMTRVLWNRAHNDPLELLVTGGLIGVALAGCCVALLLRRIWRRLRRAGGDEQRAAALAAIGALVAAGVHELMDFGLVIPANAAALAVLLGVAAGSRLKAPSGPAPG